MKYIAVLLVAGALYLTITRPKPSPAPASPASEAGTDFLKEPLDRTHQVLDQAKKRAQDPALQ